MSRSWSAGSDRRWRKVRAAVLARDGYRCQVQGPHCQGVATQVDHIVPLSKRGSRYDPRNLRASCQQCNASRGAALDEEKAFTTLTQW